MVIGISVEEKDWCRLGKRSIRIGTGIAGDDGKEECLEFWWLGTQSVLPEGRGLRSNFLVSS